MRNTCSGIHSGAMGTFEPLELRRMLAGDVTAAIDAGFSANLTGYANGDFDGSGTIDADDYFIIDRNYSRQGSPLISSPVGGDALSTATWPAQPPRSSASSVDEPTKDRDIIEALFSTADIV